MFSFSKISAAALTLATVVRADLFITNFSVQGNASTSVTWTSTDPDTDPLFITVELQNPSFHSQFAIGATIPTSQNTLQVTTPGLLPGPGYTLQLVATNNVSQIFAQTPDFTVVENTVVSSSLKAGAPTTKAASAASSSASGSSVSSSATGVNTTAAVTPPPVPSSAVTPSPSVTSPASPSTTSAGSSSSIPPPPQTGGAAGLVPAGTVAALVVGFVTLFL